MNDRTYAPRPLSPVAEAHGLPVAGATFEGDPGLTCRWPQRAAPRGCVVFAHGLGESGRSYAELSAAWAASGYLVIHPTFPDWIGAVVRADPETARLLDGRDPGDWASIPQVWPRVIALLHDPWYWTERVRIVRTVMDGISEIVSATVGEAASPQLFAIAGHSFGAYLAQLLAGVEVDVPGSGPARFADDRFAAAILLSAQGRDQQGLREGSWDAMARPALTITGTLDRGARNQDWRWKCEPWEFAPPGGKYLAVFEGATHYFGGIAREAAHDRDPRQREAVASLTLAFLDAYLTDDAGAIDWLASISDTVGECRLQFKRK